MLITFTDLAKLKGVSKAAVSKAVKSGRITGAIVQHGNKKLVDKDKALALWDRNTDATATFATNKSVITTKKQPDIIPPEIVHEVEKLHKGKWPDFNDSRAKREACLARLAEIEVAEKEEKLVPVEKVEKDWFSVCRSIRESFMNMPDRLANQLAGETDATAIDRVLRDEIRMNLEQLAEAS